MSIKHRVKDRAANGKMRPLFWGWDYRFHHDHKMVFVDYGKCPSDWNRQYHRRPNRAKAARVCRDIAAGRTAPDVAMFPVERKPTVYYW